MPGSGTGPRPGGWETLIYNFWPIQPYFQISSGGYGYSSWRTLIMSDLPTHGSSRQSCNLIPKTICSSERPISTISASCRFPLYILAHQFGPFPRNKEQLQSSSFSVFHRHWPWHTLAMKGRAWHMFAICFKASELRTLSIHTHTHTHCSSYVLRTNRDYLLIKY